MDILAHALYGATVCSRTGLAGGRAGNPLPRNPYISDWTAWLAAAFGVLPDMTSIGLFFARMLLNGSSPSFHHLPPYVFVLYHCTHSLLVAGLVVLLLRRVNRTMAIAALAWPLHLLMDSVTHDDGRWGTHLLYPLSDWHWHGVNWWEHPAVMLVYWGSLPVLWIAIHLWRRTGRRAQGGPACAA